MKTKICVTIFLLIISSVSAFQTEKADFPSKPDFSIEISSTGLAAISATCNDGTQNQGEKGIDCEGPCSRKCGTDMINYIVVSGVIALFIFSAVILWKRKIFSGKPKETSAADPKLIAYVKNAIAKGYSREQIKKALLNAGWAEKKIDDALSAVK